MFSGVFPGRQNSDGISNRPAPFRRKGVSRAVIAAAIAGVILLGAALVLLAPSEEPATVATSSSSSEPTSSGSSSLIGVIMISSPTAGETFAPGQTLTISGRVIPAPTYQDTVTIVAFQSDSTTAIPYVPVLVGTNGTFSYSVTVSPYWFPGAYTLTVTDPSGASGSEIFLLNSSS